MRPRMASPTSNTNSSQRIRRPSACGTGIFRSRARPRHSRGSRLRPTRDATKGTSPRWDMRKPLRQEKGHAPPARRRRAARALVELLGCGLVAGDETFGVTVEQLCELLYERAIIGRELEEVRAPELHTDPSTAGQRDRALAVEHVTRRR